LKKRNFIGSKGLMKNGSMRMIIILSFFTELLMGEEGRIQLFLYKMVMWW